MHGIPYASEFDGISEFTSDFAPITTLSPIVTPGRMTQSTPIKTLFPIVTFCVFPGLPNLNGPPWYAKSWHNIMQSRVI